MYTARSGRGGARRIRARTCHAPARRLARTTISLGPEEGILFGLRAVRCACFPLLPPDQALYLEEGIQFGLRAVRCACLPLLPPDQAHCCIHWRRGLWGSRVSLACRLTFSRALLERLLRRFWHSSCCCRPCSVQVHRLGNQ